MRAYTLHRSVTGAAGPVVAQVCSDGVVVVGRAVRELTPDRDRLRRIVAQHAGGPMADMSVRVQVAGMTAWLIPVEDPIPQPAPAITDRARRIEPPPLPRRVGLEA